ncbi:MAG: Bax inhibitor-1 family protein [Thermosynechococcaceae cyanobacterium]
MSNTSNFRQAIREAQQGALVGPNVIKNALPFVGGGLVLTAVGSWGGLGVLQTRPDLFMGTFWIAAIANVALFFVARGVAMRGNNTTALPMLATYSLISGYTLAGLVGLALRTPGVGSLGMGIAALSCGITFIAARSVGSNLSEEDGFALSKTVGLGLIALVIAMVAQVLCAVFGIYTAGWLEIAISGIGVILFVGAAVVDFFVLPRTYPDEQYLPAAMSMYLTYINLFVFILRLLIAFNGRD